MTLEEQIMRNNQWIVVILVLKIVMFIALFSMLFLGLRVLNEVRRMLVVVKEWTQQGRDSREDAKEYLQTVRQQTEILTEANKIVAETIQRVPEQAAAKVMEQIRIRKKVSPTDEKSKASDT